MRASVTTGLLAAMLAASVLSMPMENAQARLVGTGVPAEPGTQIQLGHYTKVELEEERKPKETPKVNFFYGDALGESLDEEDVDFPSRGGDNAAESGASIVAPTATSWVPMNTYTIQPTATGVSEELSVTQTPAPTSTPVPWRMPANFKVMPPRPHRNWNLFGERNTNVTPLSCFCAAGGVICCRTLGGDLCNFGMCGV